MKELRLQDLEIGDLVKLISADIPAGSDRYTTSYMLPEAVGEVVHSTKEMGRGEVQLDIFSPENGDFYRTGVVGDPAAVFAKLYDTELTTAITRAREIRILARIQKGSFRLGSDPEIFAVDENGVVIPAWTFLGNNKPLGYEQPFWDGFQAEFTIAPENCLGWTIDGLRRGMQNTLAAARVLNPKARLTSASVLDVPQAMMLAASQEHTQLGCAPSVNIYEDARGIMVPDPRELSCRFSGCHIHLGIGRTGQPTTSRVIKALDAIYGIASVAMFRGLEDTRRRKFYGMCGEYRTPAHGLEYRVPSSILLCHPAVTNLAFDLARCVAQMALNKQAHVWTVRGGDRRVQDIVNGYDVNGAMEVLKENDRVLEAILRAIYYAAGHRTAKAFILNGVKEFVPTDDIEESWGLAAPTPLTYKRQTDPRWIGHSDGPNKNIAEFVLKEG